LVGSGVGLVVFVGSAVGGGGVGSTGHVAAPGQAAVEVGWIGFGSITWVGWVCCSDENEHAEIKTKTSARNNSLRAIYYLPETNIIDRIMTDVIKQPCCRYYARA
jgi:hypothetical protein